MEATSTSADATVRVFVTATGELIGTLDHEGGGKLRGRFSWPVSPQNVAVRRRLGGEASPNVGS